MMDVGATGSHVFATSDGTLQSAAGIPAAPGAGAATTSPIPWTQLSSQTDQSILVIPTLASAGSGSSPRTSARPNSIETASITPGPGSLGAVSRVTPFTGWSAIGSPILFPAAGGGLQMVFAGSNTGAPGDPLTGIVIAQRNPDGSFVAPALATPDSSADVDGATVAADGRLWVTWTQSSDQHVLAKLGDARGAGGSPVATKLPAGYTTARNGASIANRRMWLRECDA
jgi:hypothetical protein